MNRLLSKSHRSARRELRRIQRQLQINCDRIPDHSAAQIRSACQTLRQRLAGPSSVASAEEIERTRQACRDAASGAGLRIQEGGIREWVEFLTVAMVLALAIRTFFYEPISIPTDSAAPTFQGVRIHAIDVDTPVPGLWKRCFRRVWFGERYCVVFAKREGELRLLDPNPTRASFGATQQRFEVGGTIHTVRNPPAGLWSRAGLRDGMVFERGEPVIALVVESGDRVLVNRWITRFRKARRGESVIFEAAGLEGRIGREKYFVKRLVGLGGETVSIGDDRRVRINGRSLDRSDPGFAEVYRFTGPPEAGRYSGHVNGRTGSKFSRFGDRLAPLFPSENSELAIPEGSIWLLGDNTLNSLDGRHWGAIPESKIVGIASFRFWPFSR